MARNHGKNTVVILGGTDISQHSTNTQLEKSVDTHDTTTYGKDAHVFSVGLKNGTATVSGFYDTTAVSGPRAVIEALYGTVTTIVYRPEGTGSGKPQDSASCIITKYTQTAPVADMVTWACDLQLSDTINNAAQ